MNSAKLGEPEETAAGESTKVIPHVGVSQVISPESEKELAEKLRTLLGGSEQSTVNGVLEVVEATVSREIYSGPLPPPRQLAAYKEVGEDFAERIVSMAEREQNHRHSMERKVVTVSVFSHWTGLCLGFVVSLILMAGAYFSGQNGNTVVACAFLAASAVGMVSVFVQGNRMGLFSKEDEEPDDKPEEPQRRTKDSTRSKTVSPPAHQQKPSQNKRKNRS